MWFSVPLQFWVYQWKTKPVITTSTATFAYYWRNDLLAGASYAKFLSSALQNSGSEF